MSVHEEHAELLAEIPQLRSSGGSRIPVVELLRIDPGNLHEAFVNHATWQGFISFQHAEAKLMVARAERMIKQLRAERWLYFKENLEELFSIKATIDSIESAIERDPEVKKAYDALFALEYRERQLDALRSAFLARKDMLVNLGADERAERRMPDPH